MKHGYQKWQWGAERGKSWFACVPKATDSIQGALAPGGPGTERYRGKNGLEVTMKIPKTFGEGEETMGSCYDVQPVLWECRYKPWLIERGQQTAKDNFRHDRDEMVTRNVPPEDMGPQRIRDTSYDESRQTNNINTEALPQEWTRPWVSSWRFRARD